MWFGEECERVNRGTGRNERRCEDGASQPAQQMLTTCAAAAAVISAAVPVPVCVCRRYLDRVGETKYLMALKNLCDAGECVMLLHRSFV